MNSDKSTDTWHMRRALRLAEKAGANTLPNPRVGAVIIKDGKRIGEGYHEFFGGAHAEVNALQNCTESPKGAILYVNLEPCSKFGKTPPCTDAIIKAGIKKVVIANKDPNQDGILILKNAGIEVESGLLNDASRILNKEFFTFHEKKRPFITLKSALSLDAKIALNPDEKTILSSEYSQKLSHIMRSEHQAILVGAGTVLADDPHLGVRKIEGKDPLRIILKGERDLPKDLQIFRDSNYKVFEKIDLEDLMKELYSMGIISVLVEGGSKIFSEFFNKKLWDEMNLFYTPTFLGESAVSLYDFCEKIDVNIKDIKKSQKDVLLKITPL